MPLVWLSESKPVLGDKLHDDSGDEALGDAADPERVVRLCRSSAELRLTGRDDRALPSCSTRVITAGMSLVAMSRSAALCTSDPGADDPAPVRTAAATASAATSFMWPVRAEPAPCYSVMGRRLAVYELHRDGLRFFARARTAATSA